MNYRDASYELMYSHYILSTIVLTPTWYFFTDLDSTSISGGQLKYGDQFFFVTARYKKKYAHAKMAVGGKFLEIW